MANDSIIKKNFSKIPFKKVADNEFEYLHHINTVHLTDDEPFATRLSMEAQDLITQLLAVNPCDRLGGGPDDAVPIKNHNFFRSINWDDVLQKTYKPPIKTNLKSETDTSAFDPKVRQQMSDDDPNVKACIDVKNLFKGFSYVAPSNFDGFPEESGSYQGHQSRPAQAPSGSINHCPAEVIHQIQVVGDHTASSPRFDAHQQATAYPAMSNTPQILPSNLSYNPHISDPVQESHGQRYARMDYTSVAPMFDHRNHVLPPPEFNMVQNPPLNYYNDSTRGPIPKPALDWFSSSSIDPYIRPLTGQNPTFFAPPPREAPHYYSDNFPQFSGPTNIRLPPGNVIQNMAGVGRPTLSNGAHGNAGMPARFKLVPNVATFGHPTLSNRQYMDTGMSTGNAVPNMAGNGFSSLFNGANINMSMPTGYFLPNMNGNGHPAMHIGPYTTNNLHINFNMSSNAGIGTQNFPNGQQINTGMPAGNVISNMAWNGVCDYVYPF